MGMTSWARENAVLEAAEYEARRDSGAAGAQIDASHLLAGLAVLGGPVGMALEKQGLTADRVREAAAGYGSPGSPERAALSLTTPARAWLQRRTRDVTAGPALRVLELPQTTELVTHLGTDHRRLRGDLRSLAHTRAWATVPASAGLLPDALGARALMVDHYLPFPVDLVEKVARDPVFGESFTQTNLEDGRGRRARAPQVRMELLSGIGEGRRFAWLYRVTGGAHAYRDEPTAYLDLGITGEGAGCSVRAVRAQALHGISGAVLSVVAGRDLLRSGLIRALSRLALYCAHPAPSVREFTPRAQ